MDQKNSTDKQKCELISGKHNIKGSCRVCMTKSTSMRDIFDVESNIINKIEFCTGLKLLEQDGLPSQICDVCLTDLSVAHKFKTTCVHTEEMLQKILLQNLKVELDDDYEGFTVSDDDTKDVFQVKKEEVVVKKEPIKSSPRIKPSVRKKIQPSRCPKKKPDPLYCEACKLMFANKKAKDEHNRKLHKDEIENFICEICGKVFLHRASLFSHSRSHLPPQFACSTCDYVTWHKHDLAKHVLIHTGNKRYQCEYCTASYYTSSNLSSHIRRFHEKIKRYPCALCDMRFYDTTKLNRHLDSHNDVKRFECEVCHSCFTRRCYWKKHLQRQHNITIPAQRPGKQKVNVVVGELVSEVAKIFNKC
ncbi:zinc finger protein 468-like [Plodia interpunctella]|uniref:zinc finger protein 468-like n=1 Tax=Plodia interpunctella TaxID=58824 RepID=UPI0023682D9F|nr:zinc finger protein 468-like [Plodia interpunctella]